MDNLFILIVIIFILSIVFKQMQPIVKGKVGEAKIASILATLPKNKYIVLNNIMLRNDYGTSQIDHVVVSEYGIFVIETKNYSGWITGTEYSEQWTKNMYGKKYSFRNPLKQNYGHIKSLEAVLKLPETVFISIVVFSRKADLKVKTNQMVIYVSQLKKVILRYRNLIFTQEDIREIAAIIEGRNILEKDIRKKHIKNIRKNIENEKESIRKNICPRCGGNLVVRTGKYGKFKACSNYPKCHFTVK